MTTQIDEVAPDLFRISLYAEQFDRQFNHFLVRDDEPLLFHTGDAWDVPGRTGRHRFRFVPTPHLPHGCGRDYLT
jgi:hypothetical protein